MRLRLTRTAAAVTVTLMAMLAAADARAGQTEPARPEARTPAGVTKHEWHPPTISRDRLLVRFRPQATSAERRAARRGVGATLMVRFHLVPGLELLHVPAASRAVTALTHNPNVRYAVPDVGMPLQTTPNDPLYAQQWGMASIGAAAAWARTTGSASVKVAVLDTGITLDHPDLAANIWTNPGEIPGNGVDDDHNGYIDDVHGWNFAANTNDPTDTYGHGTHVAGIIGAVGNNGVGVAGVNWTVRLMPLKVCDPLCYQSDEIEALQYAVDNGARVANSSFGAKSSGYQPEEDAIAAAGAAGLLDVMGAGNGVNDNDRSPFYPASYPLDNIISVAATNQSNQMAAFSDWGTTSVDLGAPGENILSTLPQQGRYSSATGYGSLSGTSMAAPQVTGAAALLMAEHPSWAMQRVRTRLFNTTRPQSSLAGKVQYCGQLDLAAATDPTVPARARICVAETGTGTGTVASSPAGISCGSTCAATYAPGTSVTLTAVSGSGSTFMGWSGACGGTSSCVVSAQSAIHVTAKFRAQGSPPGWTQTVLTGPPGVDVLPPGSAASSSFYNVSQSANGSERAEAIYYYQSFCASSDTGAIYLQRRVGSSWVADGTLTAPALGTDSGAQWSNCRYWGNVTRLSSDGDWLLAAAETGSVSTPEGYRDRCAAFVYHRGATGWALDGALVPPNADPATGITDAAGCEVWGWEGGISDVGGLVAMWDRGKVDVYHRGTSGWSLEQTIQLPAGAGCYATAAPRRLALAGDGARLVASDPDCFGGGRAYIYTRSGATWTLEQSLTGVAGEDVSISDDGTLLTVNSAVYERDATGWHFRTGLSTPGAVHVGCPAIVRNNTRIVCGTIENVGFNADQGAVYVFAPAAGGWANGAVTVARLFASDGFAGDLLTLTSELRWPNVAVNGDGSSILAPITPDNVAFGLYPHDVIGYEFDNDTTPPTVTKTPSQHLNIPSQLGTASVPIAEDWNATDPSGVCSYTLRESTNGGSFAPVFTGTATTTVRNLTPGRSYQYSVTATDCSGNTSAAASGPRWTLNMIPETNGGITYAKAWTRQGVTSAYGGYTKYTTAAGASASYTVTGRNVAWVAPMGSTRGSAKVYVDGVLRTTVNLYSATGKARQVVFKAGWSSMQTHTIKIVNVGTAGHPRIDLDGLVTIT